MGFKPNRKFKRKYRQLFKKKPEAANVFLLLCELADENGQFQTTEEEIAELMAARFTDPQEYAL